MPLPVDQITGEAANMIVGLVANCARMRKRPAARARGRSRLRGEKKEMNKQDISPLAMAMIKALDRGDLIEFARLRDMSDLPKDDPILRKSCDFHLAPERRSPDQQNDEPRPGVKK